MIVSFYQQKCALAVQSSDNGFAAKSKCMDECSRSETSCISSVSETTDDYCRACIAPVHPCPGMHVEKKNDI